MQELIVSITGEITESNFPDYKDKMLKIVGDINTDLKSDEDFSAAESTVKTLGEAEKAIDAAREKAMANTADIAKLFESMTEVSNKLRETRLDLSRQIKIKKADIKKNIIAAGIKEINKRLAETEAHPAARQGFIINNDDFDQATKGKRTAETMQKAIDTRIEQLVKGFGLYCKKINDNLAVLDPYIAEYPTLFIDEISLLQMEPSSMIEIIHSRIKAFKAEEEARKIKADAAATKEKERKEAEAKKKEEAAKVETKEPTTLGTLGANVTTSPRQQRPNRETIKGVMPDLSSNKDNDTFIMTVVMCGAKDDVVKIAGIIHETLKPYGGIVASINLNRQANEK